MGICNSCEVEHCDTSPHSIHCVKYDNHDCCYVSSSLPVCSDNNHNNNRTIKPTDTMEDYNNNNFIPYNPYRGYGSPPIPAYNPSYLYNIDINGYDNNNKPETQYE
jgi:hypothetical protein